MMQVDIENTLITLLELLFLESYVMHGGLWQALSLLPSSTMVFILLFIISMGGMWRGIIIIESSLGTRQGDP
jgi:hypothetical protein